MGEWPPEVVHFRRLADTGQPVMYEIDLSAGIQRWSVTRRYSDFLECHRSLLSCGFYPQALPPKAPIWQKLCIKAEANQMWLATRTEGLLLYLQAILDDEALANNQAVRQFLQGAPPVQRHVESNSTVLETYHSNASPENLDLSTRQTTCLGFLGADNEAQRLSTCQNKWPGFTVALCVLAVIVGITLKIETSFPSVFNQNVSVLLMLCSLVCYIACNPMYTCKSCAVDEQLHSDKFKEGQVTSSHVAQFRQIEPSITNQSTLDPVITIFQKLPSSNFATEIFLQAADAMLVVLGSMGASFKLARIDFQNNIHKVRSFYLLDPDGCSHLLALLKAEKATGVNQPGGILDGHSAAMGLLWLRRTFEFMSNMFQAHVEGHYMTEAAKQAYFQTLERYHGRLIKTLFSVAWRNVPSHDVLRKAWQIEASDFKRTLKDFSDAYGPVCAKLKEIYLELDLEDVRKV